MIIAATLCVLAAFGALTALSVCAYRHLSSVYEQTELRCARIEREYFDRLNKIHAMSASELRTERDMWSRAFFSRNAADYGALARSARIPDEALGATEMARAQAVSGRQGEWAPDPAMRSEDGRPIVPVGMGG